MENETCVFCRIVRGQEPASILYRDDDIVAFRDVRPVAPVHALIVPTRHISSLDEVPAGEDSIVASLLLTARKLAAQAGMEKAGYRLVVNTGPNGGQTVFHLHVHLLGGRAMHWPPG